MKGAAKGIKNAAQEVPGPEVPGPRSQVRGPGGLADTPLPRGTLIGQPFCKCRGREQPQWQRGNRSGGHPEAAFAEQAQVLRPSPQQSSQLQPLVRAEQVTSLAGCGGRECGHTVKPGNHKGALLPF